MVATYNVVGSGSRNKAMARIANAMQVKADLDQIVGRALNPKKVALALQYLIDNGAERTIYELQNYNELRKVNFKYDSSLTNRTQPAATVVYQSRWLKWMIEGTSAHTIAPSPEKKILSNLLTSFPRSPLMVTNKPILHPGTRPNPKYIRPITKAIESGIKDIVTEGGNLFIKNGKYIQVREASGRFGKGVGRVK